MHEVGIGLAVTLPGHVNRPMVICDVPISENHQRRLPKLTSGEWGVGLSKRFS